MRRERLIRTTSDKQISCELPLKSRFPADAHVCVSYQKKGPDDSSPVFLLAKRSLEDSYWQELGASDPGLASGDYKLQVGDLDNRSSLQFIDPKGHTLTQSQNDALVAVFQAAFL